MNTGNRLSCRQSNVCQEGTLDGDISRTLDAPGWSLPDSLFLPHHNQRAIRFSKPDVVVPIHHQPIVGTVILIASAFMSIADCVRDHVSGGGNEVANQAKPRVAVPECSPACQSRSGAAVRSLPGVLR